MILSRSEYDDTSELKWVNDLYYALLRGDDHLSFSAGVQFWMRDSVTWDKVQWGGMISEAEHGTPWDTSRFVRVC